jgi:hypothetical protein
MKKNPGFVNKLEIYKDNKLETYGRIIMPYIVDVIKKNNDFLNVVVSYNLLNNLNFLHLEMFHLGIPIIHNCKPFERNGLYFSDFDLYKATDLIEHTRTSFDKSNYKTLCKDILLEYSPSSTQRIERYASLFSKHQKKPSKQGDAPQQVTETKTEYSADCPDTFDYTDSSMFYQGSGYVLFLSGVEEVPKLHKCLEIIADTQEIAYVEIFVQHGVPPSDNFKRNFNEHLTVNVLLQTRDIDYRHAIKYSSFETVKFVDINHFESTDDVKVYTK